MAVPRRTERRRAERQERREHKGREKQRRKRITILQKSLVVLVGFILLGGGTYWGYGKWTAGPPGKFVASLGNRHVRQFEVGMTRYNSDPPTSGPHLPRIASWGVHENPISKELQVHNLEDGGVMVQYNCPDASNECQEMIRNLAQIVRRYPRTVLAPYPGMSHNIALTAWTRIDKFNYYDEERIVRFIETYMGIDHHATR